MTTFGPHLLGDMNGCRRDVMCDGMWVWSFMHDLVNQLDMRRIGDPHLDLYSGPHKEWAGYSATIHIQTSHITAHFFAFGYVFLDIFSCKPFDQEKAKGYVRELLRPTSERWQNVERGFMFPPELLETPPCPRCGSIERWVGEGDVSWCSDCGLMEG